MNDFGHRLTLDRIRDGDRLDLVADAAERAAVAARLDLPALDRLDAHVVLRREGDSVLASGRIKATLEQRCVATGDPLPVRLDEAFDLRFVPEPKTAGGDEEFELEAGDLDTMFHDGLAIDLGTAIGDSLALALDPYPRSAGGRRGAPGGVISRRRPDPRCARRAQVQLSNYFTGCRIHNVRPGPLPRDTCPVVHPTRSPDGATRDQPPCRPADESDSTASSACCSPSPPRSRHAQFIAKAAGKTLAKPVRSPPRPIVG